MDRDGLVALVESYAHRNDASVDNNIVQFIEFTTKRIGRDLRGDLAAACHGGSTAPGRPRIPL